MVVYIPLCECTGTSLYICLGVLLQICPYTKFPTLKLLGKDYMHVVPFLLNSRRPHWMSTRLCSVWASELAYWSKLCFLIYLLNIEKIFFLYITPKARNLELLFLLMVGQMKFSLRASQIYRLYTFERSDTDRSPCEVT